MQVASKEGEGDVQEQKGCVSLLKEFIDYITQREKENFRSRRHNNENSVTLTTIHQVFPQFNYFPLSAIWSLMMSLAKFLFILPFFSVQSKGLEWDTVFIVKVLDCIITTLA
jgi:hypothetical protein